MVDIMANADEEVVSQALHDLIMRWANDFELSDDEIRQNIKWECDEW